MAASAEVMSLAEALALLGIEGANDSEVDKAYRTVAKKVHSDKTRRAGDDGLFIAATAAKNRVNVQIHEALASPWKEHFCWCSCVECHTAAATMLGCDRCCKDPKAKSKHSCALW